jgi:glutamyl-tRNA synthetase
MRTRFAPSPTGFLHIGGLRTALYSYLLAKQSKGKFLLRIEDTDQERSVPGAIENILSGLRWAGISPEEGVMEKNGTIVQEGSKGPYMQSERLPLYRKYVDALIEKGHAYPCFCTPERLDAMRKEQEAKKQAPMYDRRCLHLSKDEVKQQLAAGTKHVIRMKVPHEETISFEDDVRGLVSFKGHTIDDQVLLKSDGFPTYHMAHVVDDHLMEIDIVLRGEEWLSSLPKHILLFRFLEWTPPRYAHVSLLLNKDKTKLSKRQNAVSVEEYIQKGYLPEALVNFIALLGWNPGTEQDVFTLQELIDQFSLDRVQKAGAVFDTEKLDWLQGQWMRKIDKKEFADRIRSLVAEKYPAAADDAEFQKKTSLIQERITFFKEAPEMLSFFYEAPHVTAEQIVNEKQKVTLEMVPKALEVITKICEDTPEKDWNEEHLLAAVKQACTDHNFKLGQLLWPMRMALTGLPFSPGAFEVAVALGKEETVRRLKAVKI